jgi:hypothetical protein
MPSSQTELRRTTAAVDFAANFGPEWLFKKLKKVLFRIRRQSIPSSAIINPGRFFKNTPYTALRKARPRKMS